MKKKKPELTRDKEILILDAAQRRFIAYGYSKVTMDEIADDIGMAKASLYYYFPTKDEIFRGVIEREQHEHLLRLQEMLNKELSSSEKLRLFFNLRMTFSSQMFNLTWHNRQIWPSMKPIFKDLFQNLSAEEQRLLAGVLRNGKQRKEFSIASPDNVAQMLLNIVQGLRIRLFHIDHGTRSSESVHQDMEKEITMIIDVLLTGIQTR